MRADMFEPPLQLSCCQIRGTLRGGQSQPVLVGALCSEGKRHEFVLKWRVPDGGAEVRGLCVASELVCSIVARKLGLNVPDYGVIVIPSAFVEAVDDRDLRERFRANTGPNFGCRYIPNARTWDPSYKAGSETLLSGLEGCVSFDASVMNGDRKVTKTNLLWVSSGLVMIDHALAAQPWIYGGDSSSLYPSASVQEHASYPCLRNRCRDYTKLYDGWREVLDDKFWDELNKAIPQEWRRESRGEVDTMMSFFRERVSILAEQTLQLRGLLQ